MRVSKRNWKIARRLSEDINKMHAEFSPKGKARIHLDDMLGFPEHFDNILRKVNKTTGLLR